MFIVTKGNCRNVKAFDHGWLYRTKLIVLRMAVMSILCCFERYSIVCQDNTFLSALLWHEISVLCSIISINSLIVLSEKLQRSRWKSWFRLQQSQSGMPELKFVPQFWIGSHTLTSLRTCNIQDLWRVLTDLSFKLMGVKFMYVNVISSFCFPVCIWPNKPNLEFFFNKTFCLSEHAVFAPHQSCRKLLPSGHASCHSWTLPV